MIQSLLPCCRYFLLFFTFHFSCFWTYRTCTGERSPLNSNFVDFYYFFKLIPFLSLIQKCFLLPPPPLFTFNSFNLHRINFGEGYKVGANFSFSRIFSHSCVSKIPVKLRSEPKRVLFLTLVLDFPTGKKRRRLWWVCGREDPGRGAGTVFQSFTLGPEFTLSPSSSGSTVLSAGW